MVFLCALGLSARKIGEMLGRHHTTVQTHLDPLMSCVEVHPDGIHLLVEPEVSPEQWAFNDFQRNHAMNEWLLKHFILYKVMESTFASSRVISTEMQTDGFEFACGKTKVNEVMQEMNITSSETIKVPGMTQAHKEYRVEFGRELTQRPEIDMPWVMSDECSIEMNPMRRVAHHVPGIQTDDQFQDFSGFPKKAMVWAAIAFDKKSPLMFCNGNVNQESYRKILEESGIIQAMNETYGVKQWIFQQDGASSHTAKDTMKFIRERCLTLPDHLHWPAHSPDLNCIEPLWSILKARTDTTKCKTSEDLFQAAAAAWDLIPQETVNNCLMQFYDKLRAVIAVDGQSLNGQRKVIKQVHDRSVDPEDIRLKRKKQKQEALKFVEESKKLFDDLKANPGEKATAYDKSKKLIEDLPDYTRQRTHLETALRAVHQGQGQAMPRPFSERRARAPVKYGVRALQAPMVKARQRLADQFMHQLQQEHPFEIPREMPMPMPMVLLGLA
jgi:hypothetical protein